MDSIQKKRLADSGIDVDSGWARFMGNEALYEKFLGKFCDDKSYAELVQTIADGDCEKAFVAAHTLKGVCGNLSMTKLEQLVSRQVEYLRGGELAPAADMMPEITAAYEDIIHVIGK